MERKRGCGQALNQEFCFGQMKFELSVSHLRGDAEWAVEYAHLELWPEDEADGGHFKVTSKSSVKFLLEVQRFEPGFDGYLEHGSPWLP